MHQPTGKPTPQRLRRPGDFEGCTAAAFKPNHLQITNRDKQRFCLLWARLEAGLCPDALQTDAFERDRCNWWGPDPVSQAMLRAGFDVDVHMGCRLADECGPICRRDPNYTPGLERGSGHPAGFDFFSGTYCDEARDLLPTPETREFWFPTEYDRTAWRKQRYQRRKAWKRRAS